MSPTEKRRTPRIQPFVVPCRVVSKARRLPGYLTDLSVLGAQVLCNVAPPEAGESVVLEVRFGRQVRYSRLPADVKWARPGGAGDHAFGLTFKGVSAEQQRVLESVVEEFQRRAAQLA